MALFFISAVHVRMLYIFFCTIDVAPNHEFRSASAFGEPEHKPPPATRTHAGYIEDGTRNESWRGTKKDAPYKTTGVKHLSELAQLPLFDMVWDVLPDMMHIINGIWKSHVIALIKGERIPAPCRPKKSLTAEENEALMRKATALKEELREWEVNKVFFNVLSTFFNVLSTHKYNLSTF